MLWEFSKNLFPYLNPNCCKQDSQIAVNVVRPDSQGTRHSPFLVEFLPLYAIFMAIFISNLQASCNCLNLRPVQRYFNPELDPLSFRQTLWPQNPKPICHTIITVKPVCLCLTGRVLRDNGETKKVKVNRVTRRPLPYPVLHRLDW